MPALLAAGKGQDVPVADWTIPLCSGNVTSTGQIGSCPSSHQV